MIEILIMIVVVLPWFYRSAKKGGLNGPAWVFIGALSYYLPVLVMRRYIFPAIVANLVESDHFLITSDDFLTVILFGVILSVASGIAGCFFARQILVTTSKDKPEGGTGNRRVVSMI